MAKLLNSPKKAWRPSFWTLLALLAAGPLGYCYAVGDEAALPIQLVPHLDPKLLTLERVAVGPLTWPLSANGFIVSLTHDVVGPFTQPLMASVLLGLLVVGLVGWLAVVSTFRRAAFVAGMVPVIFLLMSLNLDALGVFEASERYFLYLALGVLGGTAFGLHSFGEAVRLGWRYLIFSVLVSGLTAFLLLKSELPLEETVLQTAAFFTPAGAVLFVLLVLWVGLENVRALLWFNTQAATPGGRFGPGPFLVATLLYLGALAWLVWNGELTLWPGLTLDPLLLLLPATVAGGLGLASRAPAYDDWLPYRRGMDVLFPLLVTGAAAALAYAFATANTPLLVAARSFTAQALLLLGIAFLLYVIINFLPLLRQRLQVHRVVFRPQRLPFFTVYVIAVGGLLAIQFRYGRPLPDQVQAGQYNLLGDLTRQQSEARPDDLSLALLAERYYAESGDILYRSNAHAQLGRAALYRARLQRQNEINALRRALQRGPSERVSLRLGAIYNEPADIFDGLDALREGLRGSPRSARLASDLAQRFTQTTITDSVAFYLDRAAALAPGSYPSRTNRLAFLLQQDLVPAARQLATDFRPATDEPALSSNLLLLHLLPDSAAPAPVAPAAGQPRPTATSANAVPPNTPNTAASAAAAANFPGPAAFAGLTVLDASTFAYLYHAALLAAQQRQDALLPVLARVSGEPANAPYYEQLLFLQALTQHAVGREQAARQLLGPLASGDGSTTVYFRQLLALWQVQQGQYLAATELLARPPATDTTLRAAVQALRDNPPATLPTPAIGDEWLARARLAEAAQPALADSLYQRIRREAPFNEAAVLAGGRYYTGRQQYGRAYSLIRAGLTENPQSLPLLQAYALAAADAGLENYAASARETLREQLSPAELAAFEQTYAARAAARAAATAAFETGSGQ